MKKKSNATEVLSIESLTEALSLPAGRGGGPIPYGQSLKAALQAEILNLRIVEESELYDSDSAYMSRINYVGSLLALWDLLRSPAETFAAKAVKAKVAINYIKHVETTRLDALQLGRSSGDTKVATEVAKLRQELDSLVQAELKLATQEHAKTPPTETPCEEDASN